MPAQYIPIIASVAGLVLTILAYVFIMPKKKDGKFTNAFSQWMHDFFHFKRLFIEDVLKFCYILATVTCVCMGVLYLIGMESYGYYGSRSTFLQGFLMLLLGPILLRLFYEMGIMAILLVSNVIEINKKMGPLHGEEKPAAPVAPVKPVAPVQQPVAPVAPAQPAGWFCPNCGTKNDAGNCFCCNCGTKNPN